MNAVLSLIAGLSGVVFDFAGTVAPSGWLMCYGQAVSRTTYANLFAVIGTTYGAGDGTTTFNLPDCRGRVTAGVDNMGGTAANRLQASTTITTTAGSATATVASAAGLVQGQTVNAATVPAGITISAISGTTITLSTGVGVTAGAGVAARFSQVVDPQTPGNAGGVATHQLTASQMPSHTHQMKANGSAGSQAFPASGAWDGVNMLTTTSAGSDQAHPNVQPTLILNKIIKT